MKILENGLIPVYDSDRGIAVNTRDLHGYLGVGRDYTNWIKNRIDQLGFKEGEDYLVVSARIGENSEGRPRADYIASIDVAKELAMVENNDRGREVRRYFIEAEKRSRRIFAPPTTAEHLLQQAQLMVDTERRLTSVETDMQQVAAKVERISAGVAPLGDGWQAEAERRIQTTCQQYGLDYRETHTSLYSLLESRAHCDLTRRVLNKRLRMAYAGATKAAQDAVSRLSVIADDADLRAHFERILQDWMLRIVCSENPQQSA
jgi:anti-repressor protein